MIDLISDTVTQPSAHMRAAMMAAPVGDDVFGEDPTINKLQQMVAELTGKEAALFVTSGTQGNQVCINAHTSPGNEIICDYSSHIFNYESGAAAMLSGVQVHPLNGRNGHPTVEQIRGALRPADDHYPQTGLICLENTANKAGGTIFPIDEIKRISEFARAQKLPLHLDGARLWNASVATGISIREYVSHFDSVSLCFSKGLGAPVGSVVAGSAEFIKKAHYYRKAYGGGTRQGGILAAACVYALENNIDRLADDHRRARRIGETLAQLPGIELDLATVQTNIVIVDIAGTGKSTEEILAALEQNGVRAIAMGPTRIRFTTHLNISDADVDTTIEILKSTLGQA
jgi:threonine aldolase